MKVQLCVTAQTNLAYAKPGCHADIIVSLYYGSFQGAVGDVKVDDYKNVIKVLKIVDVEVDTSIWEGMLVDWMMTEAFQKREENIRAEFQKAITENQQLLQSFLALPNEIKEENDDDLPF